MSSAATTRPPHGAATAWARSSLASATVTAHAGGGDEPGQVGTDLAGALDREAPAGEGGVGPVAAPRTTARRAARTPSAVTGRRVTGAAAGLADARDPRGDGGELVHVSGGRADVLGREVAAAELIDRPAQGAEQHRGRRGGVGIVDEHDGLAATLVQARRPTAFHVMASARRSASRTASASVA